MGSQWSSLSYSAGLEALMDAPSELGDFLKSRRAALRPEDVGITPHPTRRRVSGLRREGLAMLSMACGWGVLGVLRRTHHPAAVGS
jgi:hypothetical protein